MDDLMNLARQEYKSYKALYKKLHNEVQNGGAGGSGRAWRDIHPNEWDGVETAGDVMQMANNHGLLGAKRVLSGEEVVAMVAGYLIKVRCKPGTNPSGCTKKAREEAGILGDKCPAACERVKGRMVVWKDKTCALHNLPAGSVRYEVKPFCKPTIDNMRNFEMCMAQTLAAQHDPEKAAAQYTLIPRIQNEVGAAMVEAKDAREDILSQLARFTPLDRRKD
jgi:hypothetical protein